MSELKDLISEIVRISETELHSEDAVKGVLNVWDILDTHCDGYRDYVNHLSESTRQGRGPKQNFNIVAISGMVLSLYEKNGIPEQYNAHSLENCLRDWNRAKTNLFRVYGAEKQKNSEETGPGKNKKVNWIDVLSALDLELSCFSAEDDSFSSFLERYQVLVSALSRVKLTSFYVRSIDDLCAAYTVYLHQTSLYFQTLRDRLIRHVQNLSRSQEICRAVSVIGDASFSDEKKTEKFRESIGKEGIVSIFSSKKYITLGKTKKSVVKYAVRFAGERGPTFHLEDFDDLTRLEEKKQLLLSSQKKTLSFFVLDEETPLSDYSFGKTEAVRDDVIGILDGYHRAESKKAVKRLESYILSHPRRFEAERHYCAVRDILTWITKDETSSFKERALFEVFTADDVSYDEKDGHIEELKNYFYEKLLTGKSSRMEEILCRYETAEEHPEQADSLGVLQMLRLYVVLKMIAETEERNQTSPMFKRITKKKMIENINTRLETWGLTRLSDTNGDRYYTAGAELDRCVAMYLERHAHHFDD